MARTKWLDTDQQQSWRAFLDGTARLFAALEDDLRPYGVGLGEYEILVRLSDAPEHRIRMADLARMLTHSRSRMTHTMDRMAAAGWVRRVRCPSDRRGVHAELTDEGFDLLREMAPVHVSGVRRLLVDVAGDSLETVGDVFSAVADAVAERDAERGSESVGQGSGCGESDRAVSPA